MCKEYEKLAAELYERHKKGGKEDFNFFHFNIDLKGGPCVVKRLVGCGSGTEYLSVTPEGKLYPCHQFVGLEGFEMDLKILSLGISFQNATYTLKRNAESVGPDSIAAEAVLPMPISLKAIY